jgi:hypothetical protein
VGGKVLSLYICNSYSSDTMLFCRIVAVRICRKYTYFTAVLRIRIRIRIHMFLGLPDPDPLVSGIDPDPDLGLDPSIIMQK